MDLRQKILLMSMEGWASPALKIAEEVDCSENTVINYLSRAENAGILKKEWFCGLPKEGDWICVVRKDDQEYPFQSHSVAVKARCGSDNMNFSLYSNYNDWRMDDKYRYHGNQGNRFYQI